MLFKDVKETIDQFCETEHFKRLYELEEKNLSILEQYCDILDRIIESGQGTSVSIEIEEYDGITIELELSRFRFEKLGENYYFPELVCRMSMLEIKGKENGKFALTINFPGVWCHQFKGPFDTKTLRAEMKRRQQEQGQQSGDEQ